MAICCNLHTADLGYSGFLVDMGSVSDTEIAATNKKYNSIYMDSVTSNRSAQAKAGSLN